jgi:integrating conjugative element protein (TIGR03758 family)
VTPGEAFQAGSGFESLDVWMLIVGVGCVVVLIIAAWVLTSCYRGWAKNNLDGDEALHTAIKAILIVMVMFWILLS